MGWWKKTTKTDSNLRVTTTRHANGHTTQSYSNPNTKKSNYHATISNSTDGKQKITETKKFGGFTSRTQKTLNQKPKGGCSSFGNADPDAGARKSRRSAAASGGSGKVAFWFWVAAGFVVPVCWLVALLFIGSLFGDD